MGLRENEIDGKYYLDDVIVQLNIIFSSISRNKIKSNIESNFILNLINCYNDIIKFKILNFMYICKKFFFLNGVIIIIIIIIG